MFRWNKTKESNQQSNQQSHIHVEGYSAELTNLLADNLNIIKQSIGHSPDVVIREFKIASLGVNAALVYISGLVDKETINEQIMKSTMLDLSTANENIDVLKAGSLIKENIKNYAITISKVKDVQTLDECLLNILSGNIALFIDGTRDVLILIAPGWETRSIEEPTTEALVRGPRDGFVETLIFNTGLIRRRIRDPNLTMVPYKLGQRSKTDVMLVYMKGITNEQLVTEVKQRIEQINIDNVSESGIVEQLIEDDPLSPFPQIQMTERPDKVAACLLEGRVAIFIDNTPFVLMAPVTFSSLLHSPEDYYERWFVSSLIRLMRFGAIFISLSAPSLYVALISYHQGLIPTNLVISIAASREGVPFPSIFEALLMEVTIELLREAGVRLPKPIGQTIGIVGGLVIGEAAVTAGLVSPMMVIVVALTAISSFALPQYGLGIAIRILRFGMILAAAFLGLYGIVMTYLMISIHLVKLKSFGVNYLAPFVPYCPSDWKDSLIRMPLTMMKRRPEMLKTKDRKRMMKQHGGKG